jgi:hypothetical protein
LITSLLAACCFVVVSRAGRTRWFWLGVSAALLALALLKAAQSGLWLDSHLRDAVRSANWYDYRRPLQIAVIVACAVPLLGMTRVLLRARGRGAANIWAAGAATFLLIGFAAVRGTSLHWADAALEYPIASVPLSHGLQAVCLAVIAGAAARLLILRHAKIVF